MGKFGTFGGEGFVVEFFGDDRVEGEVELIFPAEFETCFGNGVVAELGRR